MAPNHRTGTPRKHGQQIGTRAGEGVAGSKREPWLPLRPHAGKGHGASNSAARWQRAFYPSRQAARRICPTTMWDRGHCSPMVDCQYNRQGMACGSEISMPLDHRVGWSPRLEGGLGCRPLPCVNVCLIPLVYVCGFGGTGRASLPPPHSEGVGQERGAGEGLEGHYSAFSYFVAQLMIGSSAHQTDIYLYLFLKP